MRGWSGALVAIGLAGCNMGPFDPEVGGAIHERCANEDSEPDVSVSFQNDVLPILTGNAGPVGCSCHQPTAPNPIGLEQAGLNLSSYEGVMAGGNNSKSRTVIPGAPCDSILWQKISAGPPFGAQMPFNGPPFLDEASRQKIADWIAEGAREN